MPSKPRQMAKGMTPGRQAINRHLHRHHDGALGHGSTEQRLCQHDDLHWAARQAGEDLGHTHLPYQEGESEEGMAERLLAEGTSSTKESPDEGSAGGS